MIQKNETTTLVLALAITLGLIGGCFLAIAQSTGADLRRLLDSNSENPTSPATNELNRTYAIHHDAPQLWGEKSPVPPKVGGLGGQKDSICVSPLVRLQMMNMSTPRKKVFALKRFR
jgi:hypothetical protein